MWVKPATFQMESEMEMELASEDIAMVSFWGPLQCLGLGCWTSRKDTGRRKRGSPGISWTLGGKGLRKTAGRLEKLG
jgi:hypothetical protein